MDWTDIIKTIISVGVPALVTLLSTSKIKTQANKHNARSNILQLIMEDHIRTMEGGSPENYQAILDSFDEYKICGGNSYVHEKVEEYKIWYHNWQKDNIKK